MCTLHNILARVVVSKLAHMAFHSIISLKIVLVLGFFNSILERETILCINPIVREEKKKVLAV